MKISVFFNGTPNDENDRKIQNICMKYKAEFQGGGTMFEDGVPGRDVQYKVSKKKINECKTELENAGFENVRIC